MTKIIIVYLIVIFILFLLPAVFVKPSSFPEIKTENNINKIRLMKSETGEIITMDFNEYIMGVLVGEMPINYELEALKAQAVVARTYTLYKITNNPEAHIGADMCDNIQHCQAYRTKEYALSCWDDEEENEKWNKVKSAVLETENEVITYENKLINAFFHAHSGGKTEDISNIWGRENIEYLKSVDGLESTQLVEEKVFSYEEINEILKKQELEYIPLLYSNKDLLKLGEEKETIIDNKIKILQKNSSGRVETLQISNLFLKGTEVRNLFGLRSTFIDLIFQDDKVVFQTKGYGHGVGLSQEGANSLALQDVSYQDIIKHYYSGVEIKKWEYKTGNIG